MGMGMGMEYYLNKIVYSCFFIIKKNIFIYSLL
jgi:hypothetical protein